MFLHGWGCTHETLMPFIDKLKKTHRCVCFDFFGFGKSKEGKSPLFLDDFKNAVLEKLEMLGIKKCGIVAHSFGARVALLIASEKKDLVDKMFLIGPAGIKPKFSIRKFLKIKLFKLCKFLSKIGLYSKEKLDGWGSSDYRVLSPVMKKTFVNVIKQNLAQVLQKISCETMVVIGDKDRETPPYMGKIMSKKIRNCRLEIIKNAGHFCFLEKTEAIFLAYNFFK